MTYNVFGRMLNPAQAIPALLNGCYDECRVQTHATVRIPKEHHRFVLGPKGKKLNELELATATKINIPRPNDPSDCVTIAGTREGIDRARHEIQLISDEQVSDSLCHL